MQASSANDNKIRKSLLLQVYESSLVQDTRLMALLHKVFTVALCVFYFSVVDKIPLEQVLWQNSRALAIFIAWVHISSCFNLDFEPVYWAKLGSENRVEYIWRISKVVFKYSNLVFFVALCALWPLFSWLDFTMTQLDTNYFALRYVHYFLYMAIHNIPYSAVDSMQMLIGDSFFLLYITSILLYNTCSLQAMIFAMAPMLLFQVGKMTLDILVYEKEPTYKTTFVRLIGKHDSVYLLIMFTLMVCLMSVMDALAEGKIHYLFNLINVPLVLYSVVKIMDTKQPRLAASFFPYIAVAFTCAAIYVNLAAYVVASKGKVVELPDFPLYVAKVAEEVYEGPQLEDFYPEPEEPQTWLQAIWARCTLSGFWFFCDWILYPFWNWVVMPWWNWCINPLLAPILNFLCKHLLYSENVDDPFTEPAAAEAWEGTTSDL